MSKDLKINVLHEEILRKVLKIVKSEYLQGKYTLDNGENVYDTPNGIYNACVLLGSYFVCDEIAFKLLRNELSMIEDIFILTHGDPVSAVYHLNEKTYYTIEDVGELIEYIKGKITQSIYNN